MREAISHEMEEFANALQLSIETKIADIVCDDGGVEILFDSRPEAADKNLHIVLKLFDGEWKDGGKSFVIRDAEKIRWPQITLFLLLTRMNENNIAKLAQIDESAAEIAQRLGFKCPSLGIENVKKCSEIIFEKVREKKMTMRDLAESTGLTQVTIGNFKAGGDIKLSNLIKIIRALGFKMMIE